MNNTSLNNYIEILESENKEFKKQVNELQIQKDKCENLNSKLNSLAKTSSVSSVILFILVVHLVLLRRNN